MVLLLPYFAYLATIFELSDGTRTVEVLNWFICGSILLSFSPDFSFFSILATHIYYSSYKIYLQSEINSSHLSDHLDMQNSLSICINFMCYKCCYGSEYYVSEYYECQIYSNLSSSTSNFNFDSSFSYATNRHIFTSCVRVARNPQFPRSSQLMCRFYAR